MTNCWVCGQRPEEATANMQAGNGSQCNRCTSIEYTAEDGDKPLRVFAIEDDGESFGYIAHDAAGALLCHLADHGYEENMEPGDTVSVTLYHPARIVRIYDTDGDVRRGREMEAPADAVPGQSSGPDQTDFVEAPAASWARFFAPRIGENAGAQLWTTVW